MFTWRLIKSVLPVGRMDYARNAELDLVVWAHISRNMCPLERFLTFLSLEMDRYADGGGRMRREETNPED
jgi:hypothetical protein